MTIPAGVNMPDVASTPESAVSGQEPLDGADEALVAGAHPGVPPGVPISPRAWWLAVTLVAGAAAWAFGPLGTTSPSSEPVTIPSNPSAEPTRVALDTAPFSAPLWMAPPPLPVPPPQPEPLPPPPPLRLQLLAIMGSGDDLRAVLYDPDSDKVLIRKAGESAAGATVQRVDSNEIELVDTAGSRTLALRPGGRQ